MKNRLLMRHKKNGKFWCAHEWQVEGRVGPDWDLYVGIKILCTCIYCGKIKYRRNSSIKEVPEKLIDPTISYQWVG